MSAPKSLRALIESDLDADDNSWGWLVALGITLVTLGVVCLAADVIATVVTVVTFGWLLILGATLAFIQAFRVRKWSGFLLYLLSALLRGATGYLLIRYPLTGEVTLTMILASFFLVGGAFRTLGAAALRFPRRGWAVLSGLVSAALGVLLLVQLPAASLWFLGLAIGIEFIFDGVSVISLGGALRDTPISSPLAKRNQRPG
jgi:uncharacterized membrane protein HdeD (DUF308 family)